MDLPQDPAAQLLYQMLEDTHPKMVEALYQASISPWYDLPFFTAVRAEDDGRNEALLPRLTRYSFIIPLQSNNGHTIYSVRPDERDWLQRHWIASNPQDFQATHQRAYTYRHTHPDPANPDAHAQNELYHLFFADFAAAADRLTDLFRIYFTDRRLTAMERLLTTADEARTYLELLQHPGLHDLDNLLLHLNTRLSQLRGYWRESIEPLRRLLEDPKLSHDLAPYVVRAYGLALCQIDQHVEAIEQLKFALTEFEQRTQTADHPRILQAEQGYTMIALGDAYIGLAAQARGISQDMTVPTFGRFHILSDFFNFFISLPLVFYLTFYLGYRVWLPQFWPIYKDLDWIIARLFATAARYYKKADPLLEAESAQAQQANQAGTINLEYLPRQEGVFADEKLAYLYMQMGAYREARQLFDYLLSEQEAPLGEYRRASIRVGLAHTLVQLNENNLARTELERAMTVLEFYEEPELQAIARAVLGQAMLETSSQTADPEATTTAAIYHLYEAMQLHQAQGHWIKATEVSEYLLAITHDSAYSLTADQKEDAQQTAETLSKRHYPMPYRNRVTTLFRRFVLVLLAVIVFFLMPMSTIKLDIGTSTVPQITFQASPLLDPSNADFTPDLMQGVTALNLAQPPNPDVLVTLGIQLVLGYLLISTSLGLLAMSFTPLRQVQKAGQAQVMRLDAQGIRVGQGWTQSSINWSDATRYIQADVRLLQNWLPDSSYSVLQAGPRSIFIGGSTAWYASLRNRIARQLPPATEQIHLSHTLIRSRMGICILITSLILFTIALMGTFAPQIVPQDWLGPYSLADLYPYVYLGFFIPMIWWYIYQPLHKRWRIEPATTPIYWAGGIGLLLAILRLSTRFRPWFTIPDIYPDLLITGLLLATAIIIWNARDYQKVLVRPNWLRLGSAVFAGILSLFMVAHLIQVVLAYHHLIRGNYYQTLALEEPETAAHEADSLAAYKLSLDITETKLLGLLDTHTPSRTAVGIPRPSQFIWQQAKNGRAAMASQAGDYATAVADYTELLQVTNDAASVYVSRAIAYQGLAVSSETAVPDNGSLNTQEDFNIKALADYNSAIQLDDENANYYLWRGVAYHSLGNIDQAQLDYEAALDITEATDTTPLNETGQSQALTGLGWIEYSKGNYERSLDYFEDASSLDPDSAAAPVGQGYAHYSLRQYDEALDTWQTAVSLDPNNPITYISLGTLYWRVGTLGSNYNKLSGTDRCAQDFLTDEQKTASAQQLETSIDNFEQSLAQPNQTDNERAFTYRTIAQVQSLLKDCPGYEAAAVLQNVVANYQNAIQLDPANAAYWHNKARFAYSVWRSLPPDTGPAAREWLFAGMADNEMALSLNPVDNPNQGYIPNEWQAAFTRAIGSTLTRGDERFRNGEHDVALDYYELMATNQPDNALAAFKASLAAQALGNQTLSDQWYEQGYEQATAQNQPDLIAEYQTRRAIYQRFAEALAVMGNGRWQEAATLYDEAIWQAAQAQTPDLIDAAASDLRNYLIAHPDIDVTQAYWPLRYEAPSRSLESLALPDLYWQYRSDFGYKLVEGLFLEMPGREADYATIFNSITNDIYQAAELAVTTHTEQAETLTNSNIGVLYLQRGNGYFEDGDYALALADFEQALNRIVPVSPESLAEYTEAAFKAGLTAVALNDYTAAVTWYDTATQRAAQLRDQGMVQTAAAALGTYLLAHENEDITAVYWPLAYNSPSLAATTEPDLYWRYRAEFGWQIIATLFNELPGQEAALEQIFAAAQADLERAAQFDAVHESRLNYLANTNMGNFYLLRGQQRYRAEQFALAQADFEEALSRLQAGQQAVTNDLIQANLWAGLTALVQGDYGRSADWHNRGIELAAANSDLVSVTDAANRMAQALQENPNLDLLAAYWPLSEARGDRETAVANLNRADLYWAYRAEFGFRLIFRLFQASSGSESQLETMFNELIADIETAYTLNPAAHQVKRDFFVDANIGWNYLQRGKDHLAAGRYQPAMADLEQAIQRIQPTSLNARNDYLDALFNAGLAELALGDFAQAQIWYQQGVSAAGEQGRDKLTEAGRQLEQLLFGQALDG
ncbi:MAG: tetratricopeptide repeat protein [Ardenticatenaceae bacterium]|nr:tetratricopeptide repeat protein [Ardenticatenaceae bacterium]